MGENCATCECRIVQASDDPAIIWDNFKTTLGPKGWTYQLVLQRQPFHVDKQGMQSMYAMDHQVTYYLLNMRIQYFSLFFLKSDSDASSDSHTNFQ